jgi:hypothetical protein
MNEFQVTCVTKPDRFNTHEHITHIGNRSGGWRLTREEAIRRIEGNMEAFYTVERSSGRRAYIGVVRERGKDPYLRTHADGKWNDNLLALDECGDACKILT